MLDAAAALEYKNSNRQFLFTGSRGKENGHNLPEPTTERGRNRDKFILKAN